MNFSLDMISPDQIAQAVIAVVAISNPIGLALVFINLTKDLDKAERKAASRRVVMWVFAILVVSMVSGIWLLKAFGVSLAAFQAAGGLVIALIGLEMMRGQSSAVQGGDEEDGSDGLVIPLAMPMVAGPGTIATVITMTARAEQPGLGAYIAPAVAVVACALVLWIMLGAADWLRSHISEQGKRIITRFLGLILAAIGAQMLLSGATRIVEQQVESEGPAMMGQSEGSSDDSDTSGAPKPGLDG